MLSTTFYKLLRSVKTEFDSVLFKSKCKSYIDLKKKWFLKMKVFNFRTRSGVYKICLQIHSVVFTWNSHILTYVEVCILWTRWFMRSLSIMCEHFEQFLDLSADWLIFIYTEGSLDKVMNNDLSHETLPTRCRVGEHLTRFYCYSDSQASIIFV